MRLGRKSGKAVGQGAVLSPWQCWCAHSQTVVLSLCHDHGRRCGRQVKNTTDHTKNKGTDIAGELPAVILHPAPPAFPGAAGSVMPGSRSKFVFICCRHHLLTELECCCNWRSRKASSNSSLTAINTQYGPPLGSYTVSLVCDTVCVKRATGGQPGYQQKEQK